VGKHEYKKNRPGVKGQDTFGWAPLQDAQRGQHKLLGTSTFAFAWFCRPLANEPLFGRFFCLLVCVCLIVGVQLVETHTTNREKSGNLVVAPNCR
jgi:hypothetical protein